MNVPRLIKKTLANNLMQKEQVDLFVLHQANKYMLDVLKENCKIDNDKFYYCISEVGNTVSNSIPIALSEALKDHSIQKGMTVLLAGFGVGYSWGATILSF